MNDDNVYVAHGSFAYLHRKYVGGYRVGGLIGLQINFEKKPIWLHRVMMKWCLGWEWIDAKEKA
jgi:hypothetical protein